jgi:outer membrane protein assembly factor BamB
MKPAILRALLPMLLAVGPAAAIEFQLTVNVIGNGTADPNGGVYQSGIVVTITAGPQPGHLLKSWAGADDDSSKELANTATMNSDKTVTVEFVPAIIVRKPAGGEVWSAGSTHNIEWSTYGAGVVYLFFTEDGGFNWQVIGAAVPDAGSYRWPLPKTADSDRCTIVVIPGAPEPNVVIAGSGRFTIRPYSPGPEVEAKWKSLAGDFQRTGLSDSNGPRFGCVKWKFETDDAVPTSVTVGPDGRVHVACEDGKLYALDADGTPLWSYDANSPLVSSPTIGPDGTVYVGSANAKLCVIDANGNLRWTHTTGGPIHSSPAVSPDGNEIYLCSEDGILYALGRDGSELWTFATKGPGSVPTGSIFASPAIGADGSVYIGGLYDPNLYALDPNDGAIKWSCSFSSGGWPFASPVLAPDGTIYQTLLYDANLYAIDPNDGAIIWATNLSLFCQYVADYLCEYDRLPPSNMIEYNCDNWFGFSPHEDENACFSYGELAYADCWSEPAVGPDGTIYVSFDDPYLRAVEPNGNLKWATQLGTLGGFTLTVGGDGLVYAACDDGNLYVVDSDGWETARFETQSWLNYPVIAAENALLISDANDHSLLISNPSNTLWAIGLDGCPDITFDGAIDFNDIALLAAQWLECTEPNWPCGFEGPSPYLAGDVDLDRYVRLPDLALIAEQWRTNQAVLAPGPAPGPAHNPYPPNGAIDVYPTELSWTGSPYANSYDVYFGRNNPPPFVHNQTDTRFQIGHLSSDTTYYWRIDAICQTGTIPAEIWRFSTAPGGR